MTDQLPPSGAPPGWGEPEEVVPAAGETLPAAWAEPAPDAWATPPGVEPAAEVAAAPGWAPPATPDAWSDPTAVPDAWAEAPAQPAWEPPAPPFVPPPVADATASLPDAWQPSPEHAAIHEAEPWHHEAPVDAWTGEPHTSAWAAHPLPADPMPGGAADDGRATITATSEGDSGRRATTRALDGRLARVHLRGGLLTLARASLEQMAGVGALDREALVDLAEARWRSGDLEGAAEAAAAHLAAGGDEPLAHLIVAEETDRQGSLVEARKHAAVVRERVGTGLDRLFAGEPRSTSWPMEAIDWMDEGAGAPGRWGLLAGGREVAHPEVWSWRMLPPPVLGSPLPRTGGIPTGTGMMPAVSTATGTFAVATATGTFPTVTAPVAGSPGSTLDRIEAGRAAGSELELAERDIALGAIGQAVERLALVLRFDGALGPIVLSLADRALQASGDVDPAVASIHLLRGDAYRGLGRETDAVAAYQESLRAIAARGTNKESQ